MKGRHHHLYHLLILFLGAFCLVREPGSAYAQEFHLRGHPVDDLAAETRVTTMTECGDGFLWFGAELGLLRYDGQRFELFRPADAPPLGPVTALLQTSTGRLWVGYGKGAIYYMDENRSLAPWEIEEGWPAARITGFAEDHNGYFWIATYGEGMYCYRDGRLYNFDMTDGLPANDVYTVASDAQGRILVGTDGGLSIVGWAGREKTIRTITRKDGLPDDIVRAILPDSLGNCWVGAYDGGIGYVYLDEGRVELPATPWPGGIVNSLAYFPDRELWIGTESNGLWRYDFSSRRYQPLQEPAKLQQAKIYDLHTDREGNLWSLTNTLGICSANRRFAYLSVDRPNLQAICTDHQGRLWIGSQQGLFSRGLTGSDTSLRAWLSEEQLNVISLFLDDNGLLWVGAFGQGLYVLDAATGRFRHFGPADGLLNGSILSQDGAGRQLWLATLGGAYELRYDAAVVDGGPVTITALSDQGDRGGDFIYCTLHDRRGRVWFGTEGDGLSYWRDGHFYHITADSIPFQSVYSLAEDERGHIWISTAREGVFEYDGRRFRPLRPPGRREVAGLVTDAYGRLLILHKEGIDYWNPYTRQLLTFGESVGLRGFDPSLNAVATDSMGNIWMAAQQRVVRYTPLPEHYRTQAHIKLDQVSVFLEPIPFWRRSIFRYNENNIIFSFTGIWFTDPEAVRYRYQMEGFNTQWIETADQRAVFANLPPGDYTFRVAAITGPGPHAEPALQYRFRIRKPLWEQWWFGLLVIMALGGLAYWLLRQRDARLQREAWLKKEMVESQYEALKSQINPHFLFNSFNTLVGIIEENPGRAVEYVEKLSDFYRSILQYREQDLIPLSEELRLVADYVYILQNRYGDHIRLRADVAAEGFGVAPLALQMLVENAVKHNVISKEHPLEIRISRTEDDYLTVYNSRQPKLNVHERSTGFGLQSIRHRYALLTDRPVRVSNGERHFQVDIPLLVANQ